MFLSTPAQALTNDVFAMNKEIKAASSAKETSPTDVDSIEIPEDIGLVKDSFKGTSDKLIVHIQDAHCNYEAQNNIVKILELLMEKKDLSLVAVEGSAGTIDTSLFTTFPDEEIRREVADYFMKKGKISGAEFLAINTKKPVVLFGVENKEYYLENLKAYTSTLSSQTTVKKACAEIRAYLNKLKGYIYSKELKAFDRKIRDYEKNKIKFVEFCIYIKEKAQKRGLDLSKYENFSYLIGALDIEKGIDFDKIDKERSNVINELEKKLSQDELSDLFVKSISYKVKKVTASEYYTYLRGLAEKSKIKLSKAANFNTYVDYLVTYAKIDNPILFQELKALEDDIKETLYTNNDQRRLNKLSKHIKLVEEILEISLSKEDAYYLMENDEKFKSSEFTTFIERQASKYALAYSPNPNVTKIDEVLPSLQKFYQVAEKRDDALIENTLKKIEEEGAKISALVSGGYHTEGLTKKFKEKGISYVVISPRITKLDAESPYLKILAGEEVPFEELLKEENE